MRACRVTDPDELYGLVQANAPDYMNKAAFDPVEWLAKPGHIALRIGNDLGMAERLTDNAFAIHVWFESRGKTAMENARAMLDMLRDDYGAKFAYCEPDAWRRDLLWFVRRVGFRPVRKAMRAWGEIQSSVLLLDERR